MKRFFFSIITGASLLLASCSKQLNQVPISSITPETFFTTPSEFQAGVNAVYGSLKAFPDRQLNLSETRSDNLYAVSDGGVRDWEGINSFQRTISSNPYVTEAWNVDFNGIYRANTLLQQLDLKAAGVITDTALITRYRAEARFLRAFYYFDLVRWFGKVPIIDHPVTDAESRSIQRSPVSDVYNFIISDLQYAGNNLPVVYGATTDRGRATRWAAKTALAYVYMTRSAPTYGIEGPGLGLNEWTQALGLLNEVIASGRYSFLSSYANIFSFTNEYNAEIVFDVEYVTGLSPVVGGTYNWLLVPDTWFQANGKTTQGGLQIRPVSNNLLNAYAAVGDTVRKNFTVQGGYIYNGVAETRSFIKKWVNLNNVPTNRLDWGLNYPVYRYTDVLMLKAECILKGATGGSQADVDAIINQVRGRAGLSTTTTNNTLTTYYAQRRLEFAGEGQRWHDLVRSGTIETVIPAWIAADDVQHQMLAFNKNYIIYPVPQAELDAAPGLYMQNAGY